MKRQIEFTQGFGAGAGLVALLAGISILVRSSLIAGGFFRPAVPPKLSPAREAIEDPKTPALPPADYLDRFRAAGL